MEGPASHSAHSTSVPPLYELGQNHLSGWQGQVWDQPTSVHKQHWGSMR